MKLVPLIPDSAPFSAEQRAWLNGFLAGMLSRGDTEAVAATAPKPKPSLLIAFGSQSGNAEGLAKKLAKEANAKGFAARVTGMEALQAAEFAKEKNVLLVSSTWGEGDMPDNAAEFWNILNSNGSSPKLAGMNYAVLALGDKNYGDTFCLAGQKLDKRLEELGATRVHPRVDCDVDFDELAKQWSAGVWKALEVLSSGEMVAVSAEAPAVMTTETQAAEPEGYSKKNPFPAALIANLRLNGERSSKDTRHVALSLAGSGLTYETGDALGVMVKNCPEVVDAVLSAHGFTGDESVMLSTGIQGSLREALTTHYEIRSLLGVAPQEAVRPAEFVESLRKMQPRLYSIASSLKAHPEEVHLCVGAVRYEKDGVAHKGVASTFLADRLPIGEVTGIFVHTAKHFRVPADGNTPMIMVGPGTGIAPFRAFLEEREVTGAKGKNWLFFGDQKRTHDFLYEKQITDWVKSGLLTRLDTAFSRDQTEKVYVQNRMMDAASEVWQWLEEGAHFYVCGDASRMAKDVDAALHQIIAQCGNRSAEEAAAYVAEMKKAKRYARDVY
jgi:sulfite reductase (NADPH) flavoprotein alpha-component